MDHDATIIEEDGTEVRIAPLDVQYQNASIWGRLMTNFAGPLNNFILGILTFILFFFLQGGVPDVTTNQVTVADGGALQAAGVETGARILEINGQAVSDYEDVSDILAQVNENAKEAPVLNLLVEEEGKEKTLQVTTIKDQGYFRLGVSPYLKTGFAETIIGGFQEAGATALLIVNALKNIIASFDVKQLGGPVAIYNVSSQAAEGGILPVLRLLAMLSINLGIFNLIPIPALDGGKILINLIEAIRRKPLKQETESYITLVGVAIMVILMLVVTWNDIMRVFF